MSDEEQSSWIEVYRSGDRKTALEYGLMLQSIGIEQGILQSEGGFRLLVQPDDARRATEQVEKYTAENVGWPPRDEVQLNLSEGVLAALVYGGMLLGTNALATRDAFGKGWVANGSSSVEAIFAGEWWRTITALSLHADWNHLLNNLLFGGLFVLLSCEILGAGLGLTAICLSGVLGNALNALVRPPEFSAIGASTAVFGALGLLVAFQWSQRHSLAYNRVRRWGPVLGGSVLLAMFGMSANERVDVVGHATGFIAGSLIGLALGRWRLHRRISSLVQSSLLLAPPIALAAAWLLALNA
jgi:membrane associated rhomboid family serine protease